MLNKTKTASPRVAKYTYKRESLFPRSHPLALKKSEAVVFLLFICCLSLRRNERVNERFSTRRKTKVKATAKNCRQIRLVWSESIGSCFLFAAHFHRILDQGRLRRIEERRRISCFLLGSIHAAGEENTFFSLDISRGFNASLSPFPHIFLCFSWPFLSVNAHTCDDVSRRVILSRFCFFPRPHFAVWTFVPIMRRTVTVMFFPLWQFSHGSLKEKYKIVLA